MTHTLYFSYGIDTELLEQYRVSADAENPEEPVLGTSRGMAGCGELFPGGSPESPSRVPVVVAHIPTC